ncbi:MAG: DNA polymerase III subunit delta [Salaquimonas sp.]
MVAIKNHEVERYIAKPDRGFRVVLFYGPDAGLVSERADSFAARTGVDLTDPFSTIRLDAEIIAGDKSRLQDEAFTVGMFGGERLIRVSGTTRKNLVDAVKPILATALSDVWIVIEAGDLNNKAALRSTIEKSKFAWALPCYQDDNKVIEQLIREEISDQGLNISAETISYLKPFLGGNRKASRNELKKLALYASGETEITKQHISDIVGDASSFDVNDVIDAVAAGDMAKLEQNLERVLTEGGSPDMLLISTMRHFQLLHELRGKMEGNRLSAQAAVDGARPPIFYQRKSAISYTISKMPLSTIEKILVRLQSAAFEARANPELGHAIAGTSLLASLLEARRGR